MRRQYRGDTLILETEYETSEGIVTAIDCMPPRTQEPNLVHYVVGRQGRVRMRMELIVRFDYGSIVPWLGTRTDICTLRSDPPTAHPVDVTDATPHYEIKI
jgi:hypothetical protein